tara:strand:- start:56 stop:1201 length:1146 start_codon:yes stop_codon:yes gene_type:complete
MYLINIISNSVKLELINELLEHYKMNYDNNILIFLNNTSDYKFEKNEEHYKFVESSDIRVFYEYVNSNIKNIENYEDIIYLELNEEELDSTSHFEKLFTKINPKRKDNQNYLQITGDFIPEELQIADFSDENIQKLKDLLFSTDIECLKNITKIDRDDLSHLLSELNFIVKNLQEIKKRYKIWFGENKTVDRVVWFGLGFMIKTNIIKHKIGNYKKVIELIQKNEKDYEYIQYFTELFITGDSKLNFYIFVTSEQEDVNVEIPESYTNEELLEKNILNVQIQQEMLELQQLHQEEMEQKRIENEEIRIKEEQEEQEIRIKEEQEEIKREKLKCLEFRTNINCIKCMMKENIIKENVIRSSFCSKECRELIETVKEKYLSES